jgi:putative transposase
VPTRIVIEIAPAEQAHLLVEWRRARRGYWLALHIVLLLAQHYSPGEMATFLLCARSTVYRVAREWQEGSLGKAEATGLSWPRCLSLSLRQSLLALLKKTPSTYGWCRTRWSCATLALQLQAQRGIRVSAETVRRGLHALGWVWKRAKLVAKDSDPERASKLARIRGVFERRGRREA